MKFFQNRIEKDFEFFVKMLPALEPVEFLGLAKILGVPTVKKDEMLKIKKDMSEEEKRKIASEASIPAEEILNSLMDKYLSLNKKRRKEINEILKEIKESKKVN